MEGNRQVLALHFFEATEIEVKVCDTAGSILCESCRDSDVPAGRAFYQALIQSFLAQQTDRALPLAYLIADSLFFSVYACRSDMFLIIGPAVPLRLDENHMTELAVRAGIRQNAFAAFCDNIRQIPQMSYRRFLSCTAVAIRLFTGKLADTEQAHLKHTQLQLQLQQERNLTNRLFDWKEEKAAPHTPYRYEQAVLQAVREGNTAKLKQRLRLPVSGSVGQMSSNVMQQEKYTFVVFTSLVTRASIQGGLPAETAFNLSDIFIQDMEKVQHLEEFSSLTYHMVLRFTQKVQEAKGLAQLSHTIRQCLEYIDEHLHQEIYIRELAKSVHLSPRVLSQKFQQEMHCSIPQYIHLEKVREAQTLLRFSNYTIAEISSYLQYNSQSYFTAIFKKCCGKTPQQYREEAEHYSAES